MKKQCIAMLLAGGHGSRLYALTRDMAKPGVPFGGKYRIIDFPLSNCINSGIDTVGVLTQYKPLQLNSYIGSGSAWDLDASGGGAFILPPYQSGETGQWFAGTADAIYQNIGFVDIYDPEYVVVLSGDQIYKIDFADMLKVHKANNADLTVSVIKVSLEDAKRFGIMTLGDDGRIVKFSEKPKEPDSDLASMGIYIFTWKKLRAYLIQDAADEKSDHDFGKNIIPTMLAAGERLFPYHFEGYWRDVGTIDSFWDANMDMLSMKQIDLYDKNWPIMANSPRKVPEYIGTNAVVSHSILTEGDVVLGTVENSVLAGTVIVEEGATVRYSNILPGARICSGAVVEYAIIGENTVVSPGAKVGAPPDGTENWGIATCGPNITIPEGAVVPAKAMIYTAEEVSK